VKLLGKALDVGENLLNEEGGAANSGGKGTGRAIGKDISCVGGLKTEARIFSFGDQPTHFWSKGKSFEA